MLDEGGELMIITTKTKVKGLHCQLERKNDEKAENDNNEMDEKIANANKVDNHVWRRSPPLEQTKIVRTAAEPVREEAKLKPQRRLKPFREVTPDANYPFRKVERKVVSEAPVLPGKFLHRKRVYAHIATK